MCTYTHLHMHFSSLCCFFFFNDTATTEIYTLSLHDALPILARVFQQDLLQYSQPRRSPTIFSAAMENRCSSFILSNLCLNTISIRRNTTHYRESGRQIFRMARVFQQDLLQYSQ